MITLCISYYMNLLKDMIQQNNEPILEVETSILLDTIVLFLLLFVAFGI